MAPRTRWLLDPITLLLVVIRNRKLRTSLLDALDTICSPIVIMMIQDQLRTLELLHPSISLNCNATKREAHLPTLGSPSPLRSVTLRDDGKTHDENN